MNGPRRSRRTRRQERGAAYHVRAHFGHIDPARCEVQQRVDGAKIDAIKSEVEWREQWALPAILVVEDEGSGYSVLDGNHRIEAARELGIATIPAFVLGARDYRRLLDRCFGGLAPAHLGELYTHITTDDHGRLYSTDWSA